MRGAVRYAVYAALFLSTLLLSYKLLNPMRVVVRGGGTTHEITGLYTTRDLWLASSAAFVMGFAVALLLLSGGPTPPEPRPEPLRWRSVAQGLQGTERMIYELLVESGGAMYQNEICMRLNLPKSTVSTALKRLKGRGLVRVERRGLRNLIRLV